MKEIKIKNMVCDRCIASVQKLFNDLGYFPISIELGSVELDVEIDENNQAILNSALNKLGFEILDSNNTIIVNNIKSILIKHFENESIDQEFKLSKFITENLNYDYSHLSRVFSSSGNITIEHYFIKLRIEKAKELLAYNKLNVSEVAYSLGYKSSAHFSRQFKSIVGVSPSKYRNNPSERKSLENL